MDWDADPEVGVRKADGIELVWGLGVQADEALVGNHVETRLSSSIVVVISTMPISKTYIIVML
jgi:hypothetical protein